MRRSSIWSGGGERSPPPRTPFPTRRGLIAQALQEKQSRATTLWQRSFTVFTCCSACLEGSISSGPKYCCVWRRNARRETAAYPRGWLLEGLEKRVGRGALLGKVLRTVLGTFQCRKNAHSHNRPIVSRLRGKINTRWTAHNQLVTSHAGAHRGCSMCPAPKIHRGCATCYRQLLDRKASFLQDRNERLRKNVPRVSGLSP